MYRQEHQLVGSVQACAELFETVRGEAIFPSLPLPFSDGSASASLDGKSNH